MEVGKMRKIIENKVYDTEKADEIAGESFSYPGDFHHTFQTLYRTKKGRCFFYGGGGAMTEWAEDLGNNNTGGSENIWIPEEDDMKHWLARVDIDKMLELFPEDIEIA